LKKKAGGKWEINKRGLTVVLLLFLVWLLTCAGTAECVSTTTGMRISVDDIDADADDSSAADLNSCVFEARSCVLPSSFVLMVPADAWCTARRGTVYDHQQ